MEAQIQIRRSTAAQWISANPILTSGEPGLETDTGKGKYGNGTQAWTALPYSWALLNTGPQGPAGGSLSGTYPNPGLAPGSVGSSQIIDGTVGNNELGVNAVTGPKIADGTVTAAKIGDAQVINAKIADGAVTSAKISDGTIVTADLATATVDGLMVDVADEGTTVAPNATRVNFVGAGVTVGGAAGVATVTITGAAASAIVAGTIVDWYDPTPPTGWYRCDGTVKSDLAGTLGTRYGAVSGTLPLLRPVAADAYTETNSDVIASTQPGWSVISVTAERQANQCVVVVQCQRTGADIVLANPNHSDQTICSIKPTWMPDFSIAGSCSNAVRFGQMTNLGSVMLMAGIANAFANDANVMTGDTMTWTFLYPAPQSAGAALPKTYKIIKAP